MMSDKDSAIWGDDDDAPADEPQADETPTPGPPEPPFTPEEILRYAREVVTQEAMLADVRDPDWRMSLMLLLGAWNPIPANLSTLFVVPMGPHMSGRWLNGRVPGVTTSAKPVPMESAQALVDQIMAFDKLLHPEVPSE